MKKTNAASARFLVALAVAGTVCGFANAQATELPLSTPESLTLPAQSVPAQLVSAPAQAVPQEKTPEEIGDALMLHQRYQAAIEAYKKAPRNSAGAWNKMGIAYQMMFNLQDASRCYQTSLKLDPKNPHVLNNLGTIYDAQHQYADAERMYRKAIKLDPRSAITYKNLGTAMMAEHKYKKGWEEYKTALSIDPKIFKSHDSLRVENPASVGDRGAMNYYMAKGCVRAGMNDCAIDYLRLALNEGFTSPKKIEADSEFAALRGIPAFDQLLASQRQQ
jgi:tetratricopeptide (TPR) repeat protein